MLGRGVGRTGVRGPSSHDFCLAPPNSVFSVAFEESISLSDIPGRPSLSGGRRMLSYGWAYSRQHRFRNGGQSE